MVPRRARDPLTAKTIQHTKPPRSGYIEIFDSALPGMCLRVSAAGTKSFILSARVTGKQTRITLGRANGPNAIGLAQARRLACEAKDRAAVGQSLSPALTPTRMVAGGGMSFGEITREYIRRECPKLARGKEVESLVRVRLLKPWGDIPLAALRKRHARELTDALAERHPAAAYKLHECYKRVLNWALEHYDDDEIGIEVSPFANLKPPVSKTPRGRALHDFEIKTLWSAWDDVGYPFGDLQKLLLLTGQRRSEVAEMAWQEVDLNAAKWIIPAGRNKSSREHLVPLSNEVIAILLALPRFSGVHVFTTTAGKRPVSGFSKAKAATDAKVVELTKAKDLETVAPWRWHDLRRTARTGMAELGVPEIVGERVLNHAPKGLSAIYNVAEYQRENRDALERWARKVHDIITPPPDNLMSHPAPKQGVA